MTYRIIPIVKEAAKIYRAAKSDLNIERKGSKNNLVTDYDKKIQEYLIDELSRQYPNCTFLGEEGDENKELKDGICFIIDPIDGTTNFIKGYEHSAISVAMAKDKEIICGVVYDVDKDRLYYADKGKGAYLNGKPIHVSDSHIEESVVLFGTCPYNRELAHKTFEMTEKVFLKALEIRRSGSAALDVCYVACGKADAYYEMIIRPWDWAGASIILTEAGGKITTMDNTEMDLNNTVSSIVCTNGINHQELREVAGM